MLERMKTMWGRIMSFIFKDTASVKRAIGAEVMTSSEMLDAIHRWSSMFLDGGQLKLGRAIAGEVARLVTIELKSELSGGSRGAFLNESYQKVIENIRIPIEAGCALGGMVLKPYVDNGKIMVDFVRADCFYPLCFDSSGRITAIAFVDRVSEDGKYYTRIEKHELKGTTYTITNKVYKSLNKDYIGTPDSLDSVGKWSALAEKMRIESVKQPLFGYFKPATGNTIDPMSPLGVSVFSGAEQLMEDAERQYARLLWEFESGERAVFANSMAFRNDKEGKPVLPNKKLYKTLDVEDVDFFKEWSPTLRQSALIEGLNTIFRRIEFNCGLAYGTLSDVQQTDKTAEEIKASKQRSYATISDTQKMLKNALSDLVYAMDIWTTLYNLAPMGSYDESFEFDDSIVADRKTEFAEKQALVSMGIMQPWEIRMWYFGESEEEAKAKTSKEFEGVPEV